MNKTTVRAKTTLAEFLDDTLLRIQKDGGTIFQILPYSNGMKGTTENTGNGKDDCAFSLQACFVVTYSEANPEFPKAMPIRARDL